MSFFKKPCPKCGKKIPEETSLCPNCNLTQEISTENKKSISTFWYNYKGLIRFLIMFLVAVIIIGVLSESKKKGSNPPQSTKSQDTAIDRTTPAQHLKEAKDMYARENLEETKTHVAAIQQSDPEYKEAQQLLKKINRKEKEIEKKAENLIKKALADKRKDLADKVEEVFLGQGMDVSVRVSGKQNETLTIQYVLMSRAKAYQFMNYENFSERLKMVGYKKVIFSDGFGTSWTYKLE